MELLKSLETIILNMNEDNLVSSIQETLELFDPIFPSTFISVICHLTYDAYLSNSIAGDLYLKYLETIQAKETEMDKSIPNVIDVFVNIMLKTNYEESHYLIWKLSERNLVDSSIISKCHP